MGYPISCSLCNEAQLLLEAGVEGLRLEAQPYQGSNSPLVFLVGQDPTLSARRIETVLELDRQDSQLCKYIQNKVLRPLKLSLSDVYATNVVKCTFPSYRTPAKIARDKHILVEVLLKPFFNQCQKYLTGELLSIKPRIVIALGQTTHRLLISGYDWDIKPDMKEVFGQVFTIHNPISALYAPIIHYNTRHPYYQGRWGDFVQEVQRALRERR